MTTERTRNMNFTKACFDKDTDRRIYDYSEKDNTMLYSPDFRSQKYSTVTLKTNRTKEKGFKLNLNASFSGKQDH